MQFLVLWPPADRRVMSGPTDLWGAVGAQEEVEEEKVRQGVDAEVMRGGVFSSKKRRIANF